MWNTLLASVLIGLVAPTYAASASDQQAPPTPPRALFAVIVSGAIDLNGRLDEPAWALADSITDLHQREPRVGEPSSELTVVKVIRDSDALYFGIRACDRNPGAIRATQLRRDADLESDDYLTLLIDSIHDRRSGFLFRTNPNGAMWDAQLSGSDSYDENWNGIWDVAAKRNANGWSAEFRIPFRTLRFPATGSTTFGFNVQRKIRRANEEDLWQSYGRAEGLLHLLNEGELAGVGGLKRRHDVDLRPYVLGKAEENEHDVTGKQTQPGSLEGKAGLDAKVGLSPTLTADLTVNTDFAQVDADRQVVNLTRFPLFFPEKREFFLESSGLFDFGTASRAQLFYSRRIGLDPDGAPVPILGGARLYGKAGPWSLGLLDVQTGGDERANDAVVRIKHDLLARSTVGGIATLRSGPGVQGTERSAGLDVDFPLVVHGHNLEPFAWFGMTDSTGRAASTGWRAAVDYPNDLFDHFVSLYHIDAGFDPSLGYVRRTGIWETTGHSDFMPRPAIHGVRQLDIEFPIPSWDIIANESGSLAKTDDWQNAEFDWQPLGVLLQSGDYFAVTVQRLMDAPPDTFEVFPGVHIPPGQYWWTRGGVQCETSPGRPLSLTASVSSGDFYAGESTVLSLGSTWRSGGHLIVGADGTTSAVRLPEGNFTAVDGAVRLEYAINTHIDFLAFAQYNNEDERADFNLRFHWIPVIGDDVYVVWNSGYTTNAEARYGFPGSGVLSHPLNGALVIKIVHRIAV